MNRFLGFVIVLACAATSIFGCEAMPDENDLNQLRTKVASIPIEARLALDRWAANRVAYGYLLNSKRKLTNVGVLFCGNVSKQTGEHIPVEIARVLHCLNSHQTMTYVECINKAVEDIQEENFDKGYQCDWASFESGMDPATTPRELDAEYHSDETIVELLLGPPPPIEIQLVLIAVGGFAGPKGVLCVQGVDWACADNPFDGDNNPTTSAASGGGDR